MQHGPGTHQHIHCPIKMICPMLIRAVKKPNWKMAPSLNVRYCVIFNSILFFELLASFSFTTAAKRGIWISIPNYKDVTSLQPKPQFSISANVRKFNDGCYEITIPLTLYFQKLRVIKWCCMELLFLKKGCNSCQAVQTIYVCRSTKASRLSQYAIFLRKEHGMHAIIFLISHWCQQDYSEQVD